MDDDWDWEEAAVTEAVAEAKAEEGRLKTELLKKREDDRERERRRIEAWYFGKPLERKRLGDQILKHLLSATGRNGPDTYELADILEWDHGLIAKCVLELKKTGGIKEDAGSLYHYKAWSVLHPERRGVVKHIGTVPRAILDHKEATPARKVVAAALSTHFYQTRRARAKQKALSYAELAEGASVAEKTAKRAVEWLVAEDLLKIVEPGKGRRGHLYRWTPKTKDYKPRLRTRSRVIWGPTSNP